jgi:trans-aconitate 2-methyltransferase
MDEHEPGPREWDATAYHTVATPHQGWGAQVLDNLVLQGDETVLDLGIGTGNVAVQLLERLPHGRVIGVDGSAAMVEAARARLPADRVTVVQGDLLALDLGLVADAAVSSATFHWVLDHDRLFARVGAHLHAGAPFVAQCGGAGNLAGLLTVVEEVCTREPFAAWLGDLPRPWNFATPEATTERLERAGFAVERCWLQASPQYPDNTRDFLQTITLGAHLERLPAEQREAFLDAVIAALGPQPCHDYVRLNWVAAAR